jgi:Peptidase A4 family
MSKILGFVSLVLLVTLLSNDSLRGQAADVAIITVNVTPNEPTPAEGAIPRVENVAGKPLVKLGVSDSDQILAVKSGTYILLRSDGSGALGFEFTPPGIVVPPPGRIHLPNGAIGILHAVNPGTVTIKIKTAKPRLPGGPTAPGGSGNPSGIPSPNWSGYVVGAGGVGGPFTQVSGSWTVPTVTGDGGSASSAWIGIGGFTSSSLIQVGTDQDWNSGVLGIGEGPSYSAWYELFPASSVTIPNKVNGGDVMYAQITQSNPLSTWTISLSDTTLGWTYTVQVTYSGDQDTAEWILEAPSSCLGNGCVETLADYHFTHFEAAAVPDIGNLNPNQTFNMVQGGITISSPSDPADPTVCGYQGFDVAYGGTSPPPPDCTTTTSDCSTKHCSSPSVCCDCVGPAPVCTSPANCQRMCKQTRVRTIRSTK